MRWRLRKDAGNGAAGGVSLYYASDVHGSDVCWRKFLNAGRFYEVEALIMGGDLTGKAIVPIVRREDGTHTARFLGEDRVASSQQSLDELVAAIRLNGMYPWITDAAELAAAEATPERRSELFDEVIVEDLRRWMEIADERLANGGARAYVMAGNDDPFYVDEPLREAERVCFCDAAIVRVGDHEMLSYSYANPTPWNSPRELSEEELYRRLRELADELEEPSSAVFNLHVPPYDSGLDRAIKIDEELRVVVEAGSTTDVPVGSTAVRQIIEECQPLLALHGHIHESKGIAEIGRTLAINPGSEYNTGRIHGVVVQLEPDRVVNYQLVSG